MSSVTSPVISTSESMSRSSVTLTAPSVEFSTGTTPYSARPRSTSSKMSAMFFTGTSCGGRAEVAHRRLVREGRRGPEVRDGQRVLERQRRGEDLAPDRAHRARRQWPLIGAAHTRSSDLGLALRDIVRPVLLPFEVADLEGGVTALVEEFEDFCVEVIDPGTPIVQVHRSS